MRMQLHKKTAAEITGFFMNSYVNLRDNIDGFANETVAHLCGFRICRERVLAAYHLTGFFGKIGVRERR